MHFKYSKFLGTSKICIRYIDIIINYIFTGNTVKRYKKVKTIFINYHFVFIITVVSIFFF